MGSRLTNVRETIDGYTPIWKRSVRLASPIAVDKTLRTFMRTTDVIVTGLFSPAAIAAIGLADLYARIPTKIGSGLGGGAIALSSQETGSGNTANRDEALTQATLLAALLGIPLAIFGITSGEWAISVLGAPADVAQMGGAYLGIIFLTAPARHVGYVATRAVQGTGNTKTPMKINMIANAINIVLTTSLGLGLGFAPRLEIVGVGIGTGVGNVFTALAFLWVVYVSEKLSFVRPSNPQLLRQLLAISWPKTLEGLSTTVAGFPFNSILLVFGVEVNAAWQASRRLYQQLTAPPIRAGNTVSSIIIGQDIGGGDYGLARSNSWAIAILGVGLITPVGLLMALNAEALVGVFTSDPETIRHGSYFTIAYGLSAGLEALYKIFTGVLQGAGETRKPLIAELTAVFGSLVVFNYVAGIYLGFGVTMAYFSIVLYNIWRFVLVLVWFSRDGWLVRAQDMMETREAAG
jgi:putative MATE family efflux protein